MNIDQIWKTEESHWSFRTLERNTFLDLARCCNGKILEIGPGYGRLMVKLLRQELEIFGVEISGSLCRKAYQRVGPRIVQANAPQLPFVDSCFTCVLLEEVIEHINDQKGLIQEAYRILKPGGKIIISTPNKWVYRTFMYINNLLKLRWSWGLVKNPTPGHVAELTYASVVSLLRPFNISKFIPINPYLMRGFLEKYPAFAIGLIVVVGKSK